MDRLPRNLLSNEIIPNVSAVSRIMIPLAPMKAVTLHSTTGETRTEAAISYQIMREEHGYFNYRVHTYITKPQKKRIT